MPIPVDLTQAGRDYLINAVNKFYTASLPTPEQKHALAAYVAESSPEAKDAVANVGMEIEKSAGDPAEVEIVPVGAADEPKLALDTTAKLPTGKLDTNELRVNALKRSYDASRQATLSRYQQLLDLRKKDLEKARTDNVRLAAFNSLGNALRTMAQPIGWAAGGSTAGVQPYDNRQYLEAFNRAVKASDDLRNLGKEDMAYQLNYANKEENIAAKEYEYQRGKSESLKDYADRIALDLGKEREKRKTIALKSYYDLMRSDSIHKRGYPSFKDYVRLEGLGEDLFGRDFNPTDEEVEAIVTALGETPVTEAPADTTTKVTPTVTTTNTTKPAVTPTPVTKPQNTPLQQTVFDKWSKTGVDANGDGQISDEELKVYNSNHGRGERMSKQERKAYNKVSANKAPAKASGKQTAKSIMG